MAMHVDLLGYSGISSRRMILMQHAQTPFLVVPYHPDSSGRLIAQLPAQCPLWESSDAPCSLARKGYRVRKTNGLPLCRFRCSEHNRKFTAYPPGYAPFLRKPLINLTPDGSEFTSDAPDTLLEDSIFQATLDGAQDKAWPRNVGNTKEPCFMTQRRHLHRATILLGIACHLSAREREWTVVSLGIYGGIAFEAQLTLAKDIGYQNLGRTAKKVLHDLKIEGRNYERLLESGYTNGLWGRPYIYCRSPVKRLKKLGLPWDREAPELLPASQAP